MKKVELAKRLISRCGELFRCPVCRNPLFPDSGNSLVCKNRHTFDLSKSGSVYLRTNHGKQGKYTREMFVARQAIFRNGFFHELTGRIATIGSRLLQNAAEKQIRILDAGCGEGTLLADLVNAWQTCWNGEIIGVGIDLSKEAISLAAKTYPGLIWCVGDVSDCPLQNGRFYVILNLFSPTNYGEMIRLLRHDGLVVKVVPGAEYLAELRKLFYQGNEKQSYANDRMIAHFRAHFRTAEIAQVRYRYSLRPGELAHLIHMTPLSWGVEEQQIRKILHSGLDTVTVDAVILMGKKADAIIDS